MRRHAQGLALVFGLGASLIGVSMFADGRGSVFSPRDAATVAFASTAAVGSYLYLESDDAFGFKGLYVLTLYLFHFGLTFSLWRGTLEYSNLSLDWVAFEDIYRAYAVALVGLGVSCVTGTLLHGRRRGAGRFVQNEAYFSAFAEVGRAMVWVSALLFLAVVGAAGGPSAVQGNYIDFIGQVSALPLAVSFLGLGFGVVLYVGMIDRLQLQATTVLITILAAVMLRIGFRGEVMMPAVAALATRSVRAQHLSKARVGALFLFVLAIIPSLRSARLGGGVIASLRDLDPVDGVGELGFTIRPVAVSDRWVGEAGVRFGETYVGTVSRALANLRLTEGSTEPLSVEVFREAGPIGFSSIAESYVNFGLYGVIAWAVLIMLLLDWLTTRSHGSVGWLAFSGLALNVLLYQIRNTFTQVPFQLVSAAVIVFVTYQALRASAPPRFRSGPDPERVLPHR